MKSRRPFSASSRTILAAYRSRHVYKEMGKRGRCCNCFPNVVQIIERVTERFHRNLGTADAERTAAFLSNLKAENRRIVEMRRARRDAAAKQWKKTIAA